MRPTAAERIGAEDLDALRAEIRSSEGQGINEHFDEFLRLDDRFHTTLHRIAGNQRNSGNPQKYSRPRFIDRIADAIVPGIWLNR